MDSVGNILLCKWSLKEEHHELVYIVFVVAVVVWVLVGALISDIQYVEIIVLEDVM